MRYYLHTKGKTTRINTKSKRITITMSCCFILAMAGEEGTHISHRGIYLFFTVRNTQIPNTKFKILVIPACRLELHVYISILIVTTS